MLQLVHLGEDEDLDEGDHAEEDGQRSLEPGRLGSAALAAVHAEEHDHEQEQDDDGAGVDDDLHRGQEVGRLVDELDRRPRTG